MDLETVRLDVADHPVVAERDEDVVVKGTVGAPKSDFKELAVGGILLKTGVGVAEKLGVNVGDKTGGILKGVGSLLTGQGTASTNVTETNKAGTNTPPKRSLLDLLPKKK